MARNGDTIQLSNQRVEVIECEKCDDLMVNIDADEIRPGDLVLLKKEGVKVSNPDTDEEICVECEEPSNRYNSWHRSSSHNDDSFFKPSTTSSFPSFGGFGGGGFGGFGGGSFGGGGASGGF